MAESGSNLVFRGFEETLQDWLRTVRGGSNWNASAGCELEVYDPTVRKRMSDQKFEHQVWMFVNASGARHHEVGLAGDPDAASTVVLGWLGGECGRRQYGVPLRWRYESRRGSVVRASRLGITFRMN
eukprot:6203500-Pleurochrysis_carterae.AAC.2